MTSPSTETAARPADHDEARSAVRAEFTSREQALLDAWDRDHQPSPITDAFVERLLAAYEASDHPSIRELEAADEALCVEMAAAAEAESRGDAGEFRALTALHETHLHRMALRLSGDRETAKDLAQQVFLCARSSSIYGAYVPAPCRLRRGRCGCGRLLMAISTRAATHSRPKPPSTTKSIIWIPLPHLHGMRRPATCASPDSNARISGTPSCSGSTGVSSAASERRTHRTPTPRGPASHLRDGK